MIDTAATATAIAGFALLSFGYAQSGFAVSLLGSLLWLVYALRRRAWPLLVQSLAFAAFSAVGLLR